MEKLITILKKSSLAINVFYYFSRHRIDAVIINYSMPMLFSMQHIENESRWTSGYVY